MEIECGRWQVRAKLPELVLRMIHYRVFAGNGPELLGVRDAELDHLVVRTSWGVKFENEMAAAMEGMMIRGFRFRKRKGEGGWLGSLDGWMVG